MPFYPIPPWSHVSDKRARRWRASLLAIALTLPAGIATAQTPVGEIPLPVEMDALMPVVANGLRASEVAAAAAGNAPDVTSAERSMQQAQLQVEQARVALIPRIDLQASYTRLSRVDQPPLNFGGQSVASPFPQILNNYALRATLTIPVSDIFLRAMPAFRALQQSVTVTELQQESARQTAGWQGTEAYYGWIRAIATRNIAEESVRLIEATTSHVELLADAGVIPGLDVTTTRAGLEQARTALEQTNLGVALSEDAIRTLAGWPESRVFSPGEDVLATPDRPAPSVQTVVDSARLNRAEERMLYELRSVRERQVDIQRASNLPRFNITAGGLYANPNQRVQPQHEEFDFTYDVGATISWSPNDYRTNRTQVEITTLDVMRVDDDLAAFELGVRNEAVQAINSWSQAQATIQGAQLQIDAALTEYESRRSALQAGIGTTTELLDALRTLTSSRLNLIEGHIALRRSQAWVARIQGTTLSEGSL